jgi:menaquinone-dependent protoporphyrinogen oxidase
MRILVVHASRYGATKVIAERIAAKLAAAGHVADVRPAKTPGQPAGHDAFVIGSAVYFGKWRREAREFVERHRPLLSTRPVWLFSSGPLGSPAVDERGRDRREAAVPEDLPELVATLHPRSHRVFLGALDPQRLGFRDRLIRSLPANRPMLPAGDFRDFADIEGWAAEIARELAPAPGVTASPTRVTGP